MSSDSTTAQPWPLRYSSTVPPWPIPSPIRHACTAPSLPIRYISPSILDLAPELRNRIYGYTFTPPLGHLEIFDLLEPIPGTALLHTCKQIRSEAKAMYDVTCAQVNFRDHMFWLDPNSPQFAAFEGQEKLKKIVNAIEGLNARELRQVTYVSIPSPVLVPDGKLRYYYSDGVWECSRVHPAPTGQQSSANTHPRYAVITDRWNSPTAALLSELNVIFADEIGRRWTIFLNLSSAVAANTVKRNWPLSKVELEAGVEWYLTEKVIQQE